MKQCLTMMLAGLVFISLTLISQSCNHSQEKESERPECDSAAITIAILQKMDSGHNKDRYDTLRKYLPRVVFSSSIAGLPISEQEARETHIAYLQNNPIVNSNRDVIHFLNVDKNDLKTIWDNGQYGGCRLYFSREKTNNDLSIILVPVDRNGKNVLNVGVNTVMINKLDPCPDNCINGNYGSVNDVNDLNREYQGNRWFKPNLVSGTSKNHWWNSNNTVTMDAP